MLGCLVICSCVPRVAPTSSTPNPSSSNSFVLEEVLNVSTSAGKKIPLTVEIARTEAEHAQGLMYRTSLANDYGMLFVFDAPQELSFWMKNTKIPLEVLFFDAQGKFVSMQSMVPCVPDRCPSHPSNGLAQYALEVNAGFAEAQGIGAGSSIDYVRDGPE